MGIYLAAYPVAANNLDFARFRIDALSAAGVLTGGAGLVVTEVFGRTVEFVALD